MVTTPWSENFPLQSIKFPRGGSSWVENGLNKLSWETWVYELGPLRGQTHSFHSSGWGEILSPLLGTEGLYWQGAPEEARREGILNLGTILCPATMGQWEVVEPGPGKLSPGLLGAERSGEKHTDETSATSALSRPVREELDVWGRTRVDSETSLETQTDPLVPGWTPSISAPPPRGGASIPRASAPVSTRCLLLYCGSPGSKLLEETTTSLGTTAGSGTPVCKVDVTVNPPGDLCGRPLMCCLSGQAHGGPWDLLGISWGQKIQPTSPDGWCAMRNAGPSTDHDSSVPLRSLPQPWERHLSLAFCDDMKLPARDPGTGTTVLPHYQGMKVSPRDLDHAKGVASRGKPFGPEPPL